MNALLLAGGRVIDPANHFDAIADLLIDDGKIAALGPEAAAKAPRTLNVWTSGTWSSARA